MNNYIILKDTDMFKLTYYLYKCLVSLSVIINLLLY